MSQRQDLDVILTEILVEILQSFKKILGVDRATIFLLDRDDHEHCLILSSESEHFIEVRVPIYIGMGGVANLRKFVAVPFSDRKGSTLGSTPTSDRHSSYTTYNLLALPLVNSEGNIIAFVQLINKLNSDSDPEQPLYQKIDTQGFTKKDKKRFIQASAWIQATAERCQSLYAEIKKQRIIVSFIKAIHTITQGSLDLDTTLKLIVTEAKELMNADRTTLWLVNSEREERWTMIQSSDTSIKKVCLPIGSELIAKVAASRQPINIPFDLYIHPGSESIKQRDRQTNYRTCSLLCMPIFNPDGQLLAVIELVNRKKGGNFSNYNPEDWPMPPEGFKASFSEADRKLMAAFNVQIGIVLQNAKQFATLKQQEQIQRYIFSSLDKGVIYTDSEGQIVTLNEQAKQILKITDIQTIERLKIRELLQIKEAKLDQWIQDALEGNHQQYYPNQTLITGVAEQKIDLSINAMTDTNNGNNLYGLLVVIQEFSGDKPSTIIPSCQITKELAQDWLKERNGHSSIQEDVSILCSDVRGYTSWLGAIDTEEVVDSINQYFEWMVDAVFKHQGRLDQYIGDALIAIFGMSLPLKERAWYAVKTAIEMQQRLAEFNHNHFIKNQQPLRIGIGIHSGHMNLNSKSFHRNSPNDAINFTSLLERSSQHYNCDIIISETTYRYCSDRIWVRELDHIQVKNKKPPLAIYELVGLRSEPISEQRQQIVEHYHKGREYYLQRQFALAMSEFSQVLAIDNSDIAAILQIQRCLHWLKSPPPADWNGGWKVTEN
ncbi:MAG TPA: adenylate/guanylate cyclase domain-containing protein [Cyanobacteria bacterium UBA12227]|nr:adenylate/guanylate cyclase domain-containing protein [Cyanobacteria bacterium UBA12227]HAX90455.1 adenylate/guanylate cyclase domain-containing protein [Cyanobacteria bacterium UBA11370]